MTQFKHVAIIGAGLIGGSIGMTLKRRKKHPTITIFVRSSAKARKIRRVKAADKVTESIRAASSTADLIIIATPVDKIIPVCREVSKYAKKGAIITDVGSIKKAIVNTAEDICRKDIHFVGSHPMAGAEKSGITYARDDLFNKAVCILTRTPGTHKGALARLNSFWRSLGMTTKIMSPDAHDHIVSSVSHLPHLVAYTLGQVPPKKTLVYGAGSFKDMTRIAESPPKLWRDICFMNSRHLIQSAKTYSRLLQKAIKHLEGASSRDKQALLKHFYQGYQSRKKYSSQKKLK